MAPQQDCHFPFRASILWRKRVGDWVGITSRSVADFNFALHAVNGLFITQLSFPKRDFEKILRRRSAGAIDVTRPTTLSHQSAVATARARPEASPRSSNPDIRRASVRCGHPRGSRNFLHGAL